MGDSRSKARELEYQGWGRRISSDFLDFPEGLAPLPPSGC